MCEKHWGRGVGVGVPRYTFVWPQGRSQQYSAEFQCVTLKVKRLPLSCRIKLSKVK